MHLKRPCLAARASGADDVVYGLIVSTAASIRPVTIEEAKLHLRVTHDSENGYIDNLIRAATISTEDDTGRAWINRTLQMTLDRFPPSVRFELPRSPVSSTADDTVITYTDTDGASQTLATSVYGVDVTPIVPTIFLKDGQSWPSTLGTEPAVVTVQFLAGYGATASSVDERAKQAIMLAVGMWYKVRDPIALGISAMAIPTVVSALLDGLRVPRVAA